MAGRFVPYRRIDLIARAFRALPQHPLLIVGDGPERNAVQAAAAGAPNIALRPPVPRAELIGLMKQARAVVFAAEDDFGITMVEAQACGTPVIGFARGGARDILPAPAPGRTATGLLFEEQGEEAIISAVSRFEAMRHRILPEACRRNALRFGIGQFPDRLRRIVSEAMDRPAPPMEVPRRTADGG
jgi:glycosyltransferase involved in cell wall biosynthesis